MTFREYTLPGIVFGLFLLLWLGFRYINYLRNKKHNTELWGTIFEGITNKLIDLEPVKKPEIYIEKKSTTQRQRKRRSSHRKTQLTIE